VEKWNCYKDKVEMEEVNIEAYYLNVTGYTPGLKCPICGASYLIEQMAEQLRENEDLLEGK
jgi:hypothetical protein